MGSEREMEGLKILYLQEFFMKCTDQAAGCKESEACIYFNNTKGSICVQQVDRN